MGRYWRTLRRFWGTAVAVQLEYQANVLIELLAGALPPRKASDIAAQLTGGKKNDFYKRILQQSEKDRASS